ncbi:hypothetical protein [uncultured Acidaminococcus sp.]|nr:hypothetical protein [uncultured Acidaminococcus sp.]
MNREKDKGISAVWCNGCHHRKVLSRTMPMPNTKVIKELPEDIQFIF